MGDFFLHALGGNELLQSWLMTATGTRPAADDTSIFKQGKLGNGAPLVSSHSPNSGVSDNPYWSRTKISWKLMRLADVHVLLQTSQNKLFARELDDQLGRSNSLEKPLQRNVKTEPCAHGFTELNRH